MNGLNSFVGSIWFSILLLTSIIILFVLLIINIIKVNKLKNNYKKLMQVFEKRQNFNEILNRYTKDVADVSRETLKLKNEIDNLEKNIEKCIQKVGVVRYNAFMESGSDLSFAVALLDFEDNGIVVNGVYSRDNTTTTYAKPVEHGKSKYQLVKEEEEAIEQAKHGGYKCFLDLNKRG